MGCKRLIAAACVCSLLAACLHNGGGNKPQTASAAPVQEREGYVAALAESCPVTKKGKPELAPVLGLLIGALAPAILDKAVSAGAAYLKKARGRKERDGHALGKRRTL